MLKFVSTENILNIKRCPTTNVAYILFARLQSHYLPDSLPQLHQDYISPDHLLQPFMLFQLLQLLIPERMRNLLQ